MAGAIGRHLHGRIGGCALSNISLDSSILSHKNVIKFENILLLYMPYKN